MSDTATRKVRNKKPRRLTWQIWAIGGIVVLTAVILALILFPETLNLGRVVRSFRYSGAKNQAPIVFEANSTNDYAAQRNLFLVGSESALFLYDDKGGQISLAQSAMPNPVLDVSDKLIVCHGVGNSGLLVLDRHGNTLLSQTVTGTLLDLDLSPDDCIAYVTAEKGYKSVATVMDRDRQEIYKWYSSSQYLNLCAISKKAEYLAVAQLGVTDGVFRTNVTLLRTDREDPIASLELGNQVLWDLFFLGDRLCAVGQDEITFINPDGSVENRFPLSGLYLDDFARGDDFLVLAVNQNKAGSKVDLVVLTKTGEEKSREYLGAQVRSLSVCGKYIAVLTDGNVTVYSKRLKPYYSSTEVGSANRALVREDGSLLLVSSGEAEILAS